MSEFCKGKIGDVVYHIPSGGEKPVKFFLMLGDKKAVKATRDNGEQRDFVLEDFALTVGDANRLAVEREYESLFQATRKAFDNISKYRGEERPSESSR